jgi:hypothetical protein
MRASRHCRQIPKWVVLVLGLAVVVPLVVLPPAPARADDTERAKELFQQGTTLFNVGEFDKAIEAWQQGYKEKPDPGFLWNIGQAYRLKGDNQKAIFFYRGYLRNSPKAANRAEVEAKIAALQKAATETKPATPPVAPAPLTPPAPSHVASPPATLPPRAPVAPPPRAPIAPPPPRALVAPPPPAPRAPAPRPNPAPVTPAPIGPTPVAPPPVEAPPLPVGAPPPPAVVEFPAAPPPPPASGDNRPVDLAVALGLHAWTSGLRSHADPSFAFDVTGGYTFGDVYGSSSFRLGAFIGYSSLGERATPLAPQTRVSFTSLLLEPSVRIRLSDRRFYLSGGLGIGGLVISNLKPTSALFPVGRVGMVNGAQGVLELRPAIALQWHLSPAVVVSLAPALSYSPKKPEYYAAIGRFEMMFGLTYLM